MDAVKPQSHPHHAVVRLGEANGGGGVGRVNLQAGEAAGFERLEYPLERGNLGAGKVVRLGIVGGGKVGTHSGELHTSAVANAACKLHRVLRAYAQAVHSGIDLEMDIECASGPGQRALKRLDQLVRVDDRSQAAAQQIVNIFAFSEEDKDLLVCPRLAHGHAFIGRRYANMV